MRKAALIVCVCFVPLLVAGCRRGATEPTTPEEEPVEGGILEALQSEREPPPPEPVTVRLRTIHVAAAASKAPVTVSYVGGGEPDGDGDEGEEAGDEDEEAQADDEGEGAEEGAGEGGGEAGAQPVEVAAGLAFGASSGYAELTLPPETTSTTLRVASGRGEATPVEVSVTDGAPHTAIVLSDADDPAELRVTAFADLTEPTGGDSQVRFFHAVLGWDAVDVCMAGETRRAAGEPLFSAVAYGGLAVEGYIGFTSDIDELQIREADEETPCSGRVVGRAEIALPEGVEPSGQNLTVIATGRGRGRPAVRRALLVCTDSPAEPPACNSSRMRPR